MIASRYAVEFVDGVQAEHVRQRLPLENVRVDVDLISSELESCLASIGKADRSREALQPLRLHREMRCDILARQRQVTLDTDGDRAREPSERKQEQPGQRPKSKSPRSLPHKRRKPG